VGDRLVVQTTASGATASFDVLGGSALGALGLQPGTVSGSERAVAIEVTGTWTGDANDAYTFTPTMDGVVGTTQGLAVEVRDASGALVATLDIGQGYTPGDELDLPNGLKVSFGLGDVSASHGDAFVVEGWADSDTSDILAAFGLNALYSGTTAVDIEVREDLRDDPQLFAASLTGAAGDNQALLELESVKDLALDALGGVTVGEAWGDFVSNVGFDIQSAENARGTEQFLLDTLVARREEVSGVNVDEELVNMVRFEQAYSAAARYIQAVNSINDELLRLI
jgi:flagellar hook-associated protein 1 FlgK